MGRTWIVLAESSRARILEAASPSSPLQEVAAFEHPEGRAHESDLTSDLPGSRVASGGASRRGMTQATSPKQEQAIVFARELARRLDSDLMDGRYHRLILAAAPKFLGHLRNELSTMTSGVVAFEYAKNWLHDDPKTIREHLPAYL